METENRYKQTLDSLKEEGNYRTFPDVADSLVNLCSNDYLGLNNDKILYQDFMTKLSANNNRFSACSSRLLNGNTVEHKELEDLIADSYKAEAALLFNSGYHANIGILPALAGKKDLIVADKLVHASIIDGARLSPATVVRYSHTDYAHLEKILEKNRSLYEQVFIVSESVFSMDGDQADLRKLVELKHKYNCFLYIDEAHAVGVMGRNGLGCVEEAQVLNDVDFIVGTFGKAIASVGAFVVCRTLFKEYLVNHSRSLIYTTALPPINLVWTKFVFEKLPELNHRREKLKKLSSQFAELLNSNSQSHIIPLIIGSNKATVEASQLLRQNGFNVLPIRYPTVPNGTARLRFSLSADLSIETLMPIKNILEKNE